MIPGIVEQQHTAAQRGVARNHVPRRHHQVVARLEHLRVRETAGRDHHHVGCFGDDVGLLGHGVETKLDAARGALLHPPIDDAHHFETSRAARGQSHLAARLTAGLEHDHRVTAVGRDPRRFQSRGPRADHDHLALDRRRRDLVRHEQFAAGGRVVNAIGRAALVDAIQAVIGADARSDLLFPSLHNLAHDVRIRHVGSSHADHVDLAGGDRVTCRGDVLNPGGVKGRELRGGADLAGEIQMRGRGHALNGNQIGQSRIRVDVAAHHVQEIDHAAHLQPARDVETVLLVEAAVENLIAGVAHADDERRPHAFADGGEHVEREFQPVIERPAVGPVERIGQRRPELIHQMAVGLQLDAVEPRGIHALRGVRVVLDDALDIPILDLLGKGAMGRLLVERRRDHRQPEILVPASAPSEMRQLDHDRRAVLVAGVRQVFHPGDDFIFEREDVVEYRRAVARDGRRPGGHRQRHAGLGTFHVVRAIALLRHALLRIRRFMRRRHDPVLEGQVLQLKRLQ